MQVAVILVNWNQSASTIRCIESLVENAETGGRISFEVIVVDNNSEDQAVRELEHFLLTRPHLPVRLIKNAVNAGFAGGNNLGIRSVLAEGSADYIWLLNNDIVVQSGALHALAKAARQYPDVKIWGSTIYEMFPRLHFHCAGGFRYNALLSIPTPITFPKGQSVPKGLYHPLPEMNYPAGASMFVRASTFRESGLLNETYFLYYEELDLVHQIGGKKYIAWCPDSVLHHESGQSTGSKDPNKGLGSDIAHYHGNLSALKYTWLHHPLYFPIVFLFRFFTKSLLFLYHRDYAGFSPLIRAYRDFFRWLGGSTGRQASGKTVKEADVHSK